MNEGNSPEPLHERRVTWALIAAVILFVVLMSTIVLWITTNLIRNEMGSSTQPTRTRPVTLDTEQPPAANLATETELSHESIWTPVPLESTREPVLAEATFTPLPKRTGYVRWNYWYVKPNRVKLGGCVQVTWETVNAVTLQLYRDQELILDNAPAASTLDDCPTQVGYTVYRMVGVNNVGESNWIQNQVRVDNP